MAHKSKSPQFIADYLNSLSMNTLRFEVVPFLLIDDEELLHDTISMFINAIFKHCKDLNEILDLADSIQIKRENKEENVFAYADFNELIESSGGELYREACEKLSAEILDYLHPYFSGVVCENSALIYVLNNEWEKQ